MGTRKWQQENSGFFSSSSFFFPPYGSEIYHLSILEHPCYEIISQACQTQSSICIKKQVGGGSSIPNRNMAMSTISSFIEERLGHECGSTTCMHNPLMCDQFLTQEN
jgi:hypothetical protein